MSRIAYVNGHYQSLSAAHVHIEDRGFQFSDGVYEVCLYLNGKALDFHPHMDRLDRSLLELSITPPMGRRPLGRIMDRLVARNRLRHATLYLQVTRGVAKRDHAFPACPPRPTLVMVARRFDPFALLQRQNTGVHIATQPDDRWSRCDIKSVSLLGNVLAKQAAKDAGADEAWMLDSDGLVTEGASTTAWIVQSDGTLRTRQLGNDILPGITRQVIMEIARENDLAIVEEPFTPRDAQGAQEAFIASTTAGVMPVIAIDGKQIGTGRPGPVSRDLIARHWSHTARETGFHPDQDGLLIL